MSNWTILIYVVAAGLAVQGLLALMTAHRKQSVRQMMNEELVRKEGVVRAPDGVSPPTETIPIERRSQTV